MANLVEWVEECAGGEEIEAVVIGGMGWDGNYGADEVPTWSAQRPHHNELLSWAKARPLLDYSFDCGFGAPACNSIVAWTKSWVISISQYDGSTSPFRIPRNPTAHEPDMPGG